MIFNIFFKEESGQGMVEYGLILALTALIVVGALRSLGQNIVKPMYDMVKDVFP
ncbi:pilus assembly protein Flp/PilA [Keratinibaculum paraultunense]|uniref:Pilus assembly protein Flp/PilA n=1 Tax=Keratinibaculum paraultunense TaxID=1278232 RepID=A0A4R3L2M4_9FIRM|nr:Flp family type IVb pilin [Keratinibaculum paraultunense]QQY80122.1 Flp family type IVb pilin [Keratinibaculum paraultunense]TCS91557.1 pilus assembly protein Flp/PilA [Keratinibaculum paraultunense]